MGEAKQEGVLVGGRDEKKWKGGKRGKEKLEEQGVEEEGRSFLSSLFCVGRWRFKRGEVKVREEGTREKRVGKRRWRCGGK